MIGKLIIFGIIAAAVIVIAPNLLKQPPHAPSIETIKQGIDKVKQIQANATGSVGYGGILGNSGPNGTSAKPADSATNADTTTSTGGQATNSSQVPPQNLITQTYTGQVFSNSNGTCQVSVPGMAATVNGQQELTHVIDVPNCNLKVNQPVQVTSTSTTPKQNSTGTPDFGNVITVTPYQNNDGSSPNPTTPPSQTSDPPAPPYFQTVQLSAVNQGTNALLSYDDTTGQTIQVTVTMKNSQKVLFSGTFYASQFHTEVNDVPNTPHIIEMTIQNAIYGTLHASVYAPPNIQNSTISGVFAN